jgi:Fe-S cluster biogenesis protein NfuA
MATDRMAEFREAVERSLDTIRPYLQADGGDVELIAIDPDGIVEVKLIGACQTCPMSVLTLRAGIERALMLQVPAVKRVEAVT